MASTPISLDNPVQDYAWGSKTAIAAFLGRPPSGGPEAELWIGAHPKAPSRAAGDGTSLLELIRRAPENMLGTTISARFGAELPFLLKLIAAAEPLSIQCHPNLEQARAGFERETRAGIPLSAPERNYRDAHHKPELVAALAPFVALQSFRPVEEILDHLRSVRAPEIEAPLAALDRARDSNAFKSLFSFLLTLDPEPRQALVGRVAAAARTHHDVAWHWVGELCRRHPGDVGVLAPLLLNLIELQPEEALYLPAGELHAYLEGTAIEIMANSDNVLRGGLTTKHVDVPELLAIASFRMGRPQVLHPETRAPGESVYRTPAREFELAFLDVTPGQPWMSPPGRGVELLLGMAGDVVLAADGRCSLAKGRAAFVPAAVAAYRLEGAGRVCRAAVPASGAS